jgi:hypothetical protein
MCHDWWDETLYQQRIKLAKEEADKRRQSADRPVSPQGPKPAPKGEPDRQTQPDAVPV